MGVVTTSRLGLQVPDGDALDDVPTWMLSLATQLDSLIGPASHGLLSARPISSSSTPGIVDRTYWATDTQQLYRDNGTGWDAIGPYGSLVAQGNFDIPGSTGNHDVTGVGFQPKMVKFWMNLTDQSDAAATWMEGGATGPSNRWAMFIRATGSAFQRRALQNRCIYEVTAPPVTTTNSADFVNFLPDGFRLNWLQVAGSRLIIWQAWG